MGKLVRTGKLVTSHTVTAVHSTYAGVFNCTDAEGIHPKATFSLNGTSNPGSNLYAYVANKRVSYSGTVWDIGLNWGISVSVGDTVYFSWRENGMQVAKKNVDVTKGVTRNLLFDTRIRRRGVIYATGTTISSNLGSDYKGTKETLSYVPLVITAEDKGGANYNYAINTNDSDAVNEVSQFTTTTQYIIPSDFFAHGAFYGGTSKAHIFGRAKSGASCTNFSFKVLRIPCGYGHMTSANFDNPLTTVTGGSHQTISNIGLVNNLGQYKSLGNKRVILGKITNSTAGLSNARGLYASREGTDITTCNKDDFIFGTDSGVITESFRGDVQNLAVNYSSVVNSGDVPITRAVTNISSSSNVTLSVFNPYALAAAASLTYATTGATASSIGISASSSAGVYTYTFSTSSSSTLTFTPNFNVLSNNISLL